MNRELQRLDWHERSEGRSWHCRFRERQPPGCSIIAAIAAAPVLLFLVKFGPASAGGGALPIFGLLLMALPVLAANLLALGAERDNLAFRSIHVDRDQLSYERSPESREVIAASAVRDIVEKPYCIHALDGEGKVLLAIYTRSPAFVSRRLRAALERARQPATYRG